jgi:hypothetical protein
MGNSGLERPVRLGREDPSGIETVREETIASLAIAAGLGIHPWVGDSANRECRY